jgi:hypothetical protein
MAVFDLACACDFDGVSVGRCGDVGGFGFHYSADISGHLRTAQGLFLPPHEKSAFYSVKKSKKT